MKKLTALFALIICLAGSTLLFAQLDPDWHAILQNGAQAGIIYVPERAAGSPVYAEHWILFPNYVYPNATNPVVTEIVPAAGSRYSSDEDFFRAAPWGTGYRYVRVLSYDTTTLPGR